jgi:hypothetical protein
MLIGLTILAVLTFIAIGEVRKTQGIYLLILSPVPQDNRKRAAALSGRAASDRAVRRVRDSACTVPVSNYLKGSAFPKAEWSLLRQIRPPLRHR